LQVKVSESVDEILLKGRSARDSSVLTPTDEDLASAESAIQFKFPASYRRFVELGGLSELRIRERVLSPEEIRLAVSNSAVVGFVPFADNGCGDMVGWKLGNVAEPEVVLFNHNERRLRPYFLCFSAWLAANRF
jgi:hypothetical protein